MSLAHFIISWGPSRPIIGPRWLRYQLQKPNLLISWLVGAITQHCYLAHWVDRASTSTYVKAQLTCTLGSATWILFFHCPFRHSATHVIELGHFPVLHFSTYDPLNCFCFVMQWHYLIMPYEMFAPHESTIFIFVMSLNIVLKRRNRYKLSWAFALLTRDHTAKCCRPPQPKRLSIQRYMHIEGSKIYNLTCKSDNFIWIHRIDMIHRVNYVGFSHCHDLWSIRM